MSLFEPRVAGSDRSDVYPELTRKIIGAAFEVHNQLGRGFLEKVYENALLVELGSRLIEVESQAAIPVAYKGQSVGLYFADLLVEGKVIVEVKAVESLTAVHESQLLHYLKATGIRIGLLLNFATDRVQIKRLVRTK